MLEVNSTIRNAEPYRSVLQEVDIQPEEDVLMPKESPMSLDRSLIFTDSDKKDSRSKREACKTTRTNFYDIDEYRADIYHYFRNVEVSMV